MKTLAIALLLCTGIAQASGEDTYIWIDTPCEVVAFQYCDVQEIRSGNYGANASTTNICAEELSGPQDKEWTPQPHPDGLPLDFHSRIDIYYDKGRHRFQQCELLDLVESTVQGWQVWECAACRQTPQN